MVVVVCSENKVIFGMLTVMSISRLPTFEMHWSETFIVLIYILCSVCVCVSLCVCVSVRVCGM